MHEVLVNWLGGLGLPRKSVVRLTDRPNMTLEVYRPNMTLEVYHGRKTTTQQSIVLQIRRGNRDNSEIIFLMSV